MSLDIDKLLNVYHRQQETIRPHIIRKVGGCSHSEWQNGVCPSCDDLVIDDFDRGPMSARDWKLEREWERNWNEYVFGKKH